MPPTASLDSYAPLNAVDQSFTSIPPPEEACKLSVMKVLLTMTNALYDDVVLMHALNLADGTIDYARLLIRQRLQGRYANVGL